MASGGHGSHDSNVCAHAYTNTCLLACMHATFLHAHIYTPAKLGQIRDIKVSMKLGEHASQVKAHL